MTFVLATEAAEHGGAVNQLLFNTGGVVDLAWLIPLIPLLGFALCLLLTKTLKDAVAYVAMAASGAALVLAVLVFFQVQGDPGTYVVPIADFITAGSFSVPWEILIDQLTAVMLLVVTGVGFLVHVYSHGYMHGDSRFPRFFAYLNLFLFSMLVLVLGSSLLTLFVGWELVGLSSYLLIGFWFEKREYAAAAKKAFITNRVGDVSFMVAMFLIFNLFGSLSFTEWLPLTDQLTPGYALAISLLLMGGAAAKSAQIPLYVWLPDAMAGPTPVSALIHAATMVTAGVYLMVRVSPLLIHSVDAMTIIAWIGAATALLAALIAVRQDDIKKILAYSTVSQLGFMFIAVGTGGFSEGIFHLVTHAFFKGLLFLAAGSVMHAMANRTDAWGMGGLFKKMPITAVTSAIAVLAISGIPPFAGFFSKDQLLTTAYENGFTGVWAVGIAAATLTAFYMGRWYFLIFLGEPRWGDDVHPHESPLSMTVPLIILGVLSAGAGAVLNFSHHGPFYNWLQPAVASTEGVFPEIEHTLSEGNLIVISIVAGALGLGLAFFLYVMRKPQSGMDEPMRVLGPIAELMEKKFFVDEVYEGVFVTFGGWLANRSAWFDRTIIDGAVNGVGGATVIGAKTGRRLQTGFVRSYLGMFVAGLIVIAVILVWQVR